jgi:hypothetical protein
MKNTLLSFVAAISFVSLAACSAALDKAKQDTAKTDVMSLSAACEQFYAMKGKAPASLAELVDAKMVQSPPKDPWGHDYALTAPGAKSGKTVDVVSNGPDGAANTADDIGNW